jgi:hypothetical protein
LPRDPRLTAAEARLKVSRDKARRAKMGTPIDLSDADLDTLSNVTPADAKAAEAHARRYGSPLFNAMLGAEPVDDNA